MASAIPVTLNDVNAALTGESVPTDKTTDPVSERSTVGNREGMAFSCTLVASGALPLQALFETEAIPLWVWPWLLLGGLVFFLAVEGEKLIIRLVRPSRGSAATAVRVPA